MSRCATIVPGDRCTCVQSELVVTVNRRCAATTSALPVAPAGALRTAADRTQSARAAAVAARTRVEKGATGIGSLQSQMRHLTAERGNYLFSVMSVIRRPASVRRVTG